MQTPSQFLKRYLVASDFDQTLSFHDSGYALSEMVGIPGKEFERKTAILSVQNFVQQGAELSYLLLHDPDLKGRVRKEHLRQAGKAVRLKKNIRQLARLLPNAIDGYEFDFHVVSAAPQKVIESALEGILPPDHIHGTELVYDASGRVETLVRVTAGYGKVATLDEAISLMAEYQLGKTLSKENTDSIATFLNALTGEVPAEYVKEPELPKSTSKTPKAEQD